MSQSHAARPDGPCKNCGATLDATQRFCGACGQHAATERLTLHEIGHELVHAIAHVDRSVFSLVRMLFLRPGFVAREYVDGRRKRYFGPFSFLFIVVGLATAVVALSGIKVVIADSDNAIARGVQHHVNLVFLAQVPLLAAYTKLFFFRQRLNLAESLVLSSYATSMRTIWFVVFLVPGYYWLHPSTLAVLYAYYGYSLLWLSYFGYACMQFFSGNRAGLWLRGAMVAALTQATVQVFIISLGSMPWVSGPAD
jgi:hypothetical protein